jgi:hypothetical protein
MKKLLLILSLFITLSTSAQTDSTEILLKKLEAIEMKELD